MRSTALTVLGKSSCAFITPHHLALIADRPGGLAASTWFADCGVRGADLWW